MDRKAARARRRKNSTLGGRVFTVVMAIYLVVFGGLTDYGIALNLLRLTGFTEWNGFQWVS
jgi:hypothetical protein